MKTFAKKLGIAEEPNRVHAEIEATYDYCDGNGTLLYQAVRYRPKTFKQRQPDVNGWLWNMKGVRRVPYRLPELLASRDSGSTIFIPEGEKDVERLRCLGLTATCNVGGAGKWLSDYGEYFRGRAVAILPDQDEPGKKHANQVAQYLHGIAASVRIVVPDAIQGKDISDWLDNGLTVEKLIDAARNAPEWEPSSNLPIINIDEKDLPTISAQAWKAIEAANNPPSLFRQGSRICRIETDEDGYKYIRDVNAAALRHTLAREAIWKQKGRSAYPPIDVVNDMLATPEPPLPILQSIVAAPIYGRDGKLNTKPGYDAGSQCFYAPSKGFILPEIPERPSARDIEQAKNHLFEFMADFPFIGISEKVHALALIILQAVRYLIDGPTPLHLVEAPAAGTGKTLLASLALYIWLGVKPAMLPLGRGDDEVRKKITSRLAEGATVIFWDNVSRLDSQALLIALTGRRWEDRLLGGNETVSIPVRCVWIASGNNVSLTTEMARRCVRIRLDAKVDRAWTREGFRHPDLDRWVDAQRPWLVWSVLVLVQAWIAAGRRHFNGRKLGGFEAWSNVVGGILQAAGIDGFLGNLDEFYEASDQEGAEVREFIVAWWDKFNSEEVSTGDLYGWMIKTDQSTSLLGEGKEQGQKVRLGRVLAGLRDRRFEDIQVQAAQAKQRAMRWKLVRVSAPKSESVSLSESQNGPTKGEDIISSLPANDPNQTHHTHRDSLEEQPSPAITGLWAKYSLNVPLDDEFGRLLANLNPEARQKYEGYVDMLRVSKGEPYARHYALCRVLDNAESPAEFSPR